MEDAKKTYILPIETEPTAKVVSALIGSSERKTTLDYYDKLYEYYKGIPVTSRPTPHDIRAITAHARYITKINAGYLLGNPVTYLATEGVDIEPVLDKYRNQRIGNLDVNLATQASIFGHAFERVYTNPAAQPSSALVDPRNVILVRDNTVEHNKQFAIIYNEAIDAFGEKILGTYDVTILTKTEVRERRLGGGGLTPFEGKQDIMHGYGDVPLIEYLNDVDRVGDFESIITLIDAYNILQSDRVIDRERLVDAILAFYGIGLTPDQQQDLQESRILANLPGDSKVEYVVKNINEADADVLRTSILEDIHKISMTPNMSDENFAGNSSGVALLYKLLAFEQHTKDKERYFESGLAERFTMYNHFLATANVMSEVNPSEIDIAFRRALPQNDLEISQMINNLIGIVDKETLVSRLSFVNDAKETVELAEAEENTRLKSDLEGFGTAGESVAETTDESENQDEGEEENEAMDEEDLRKPTGEEEQA